MILLKVGLKPLSTTCCMPRKVAIKYQTMISCALKRVRTSGRTTTALNELARRLPHVVYVGEFHTRDTIERKAQSSSPNIDSRTLCVELPCRRWLSNAMATVATAGADAGNDVFMVVCCSGYDRNASPTPGGPGGGLPRTHTPLFLSGVDVATSPMRLWRP